MNTYKVYLAGSIRGLNYNEATEWREKVKIELSKYGIDGYSPMRAKSYLKPINDVGVDRLKDSYAEHPLSTMKAIVCRDFLDCTKSNLIIVYLKGAKEVSMGTIMEIAWAYQARVPIVLVMEKAGNIHEHGMITQCCDFRVETLDEAIEIVKAILLP